MTEAFKLAPTDEPVAANVIWNDGGVLTLSVGIPPAISSQPSSVSVYEGEHATFAVVATGVNSYQWQKQESGAGAWSNVSGATSASYITAATVLADDNTDKYRCVLTGTGGTTTSDAVTLTVLSATLLDNTNLETAYVAYNPFRKLRAAYSGNAIRVRRSSDSTEQDIGFSGNTLDTASLLTFCGAGNGFVTTIYDQSGTGINLTQSTTANQPQIVSSGALMLSDFRAVMVHDSTDVMASTSLTLSDVSAATLVMTSTGPQGNDKVMWGTGTDAATQKNLYYNSNSSGRNRVGTTSGSATYNLWDRTVAQSNRLPVGAIIDRSLSAGAEVVPIYGDAVGTTGWTQAFSADMSSTFSNGVQAVGSTGNAIRWDSLTLYKRALSSGDAATMLGWLGAGPEGVSIGDSTVAAYSGTTAVGQYVYTDSERCSRAGIAELANPGDTIAQQKTAWTNYANKSSAKWVIVQIGLNDTDPAVATATTIAALQDLITTIRSGVSATCKIIMCTMIPVYNRFVTLYGGDAALALAKWRAMNEAIMGRGASAITNVDARTEDHTTALTTLVSGNETLNASYDTGDGVHENNAGRQIVAAAWRDALESLGLI